MSAPEGHPDLYSGRIAGLDLGAVLEAAPDVLDRGWALLTVVDSSRRVPDLPSIGMAAAAAGIPAVRVGGSLALRTDGLRVLAEDGLVTGFDEVWLFEGVPTADKPASIRLTAGRPLPDLPPADLVAWMSSSGCRLGLGDGEGLSYVTPDADVAGLIERLAG